jgi:hypothetical protein
VRVPLVAGHASSPDLASLWRIGDGALWIPLYNAPPRDATRSPAGVSSCDGTKAGRSLGFQGRAWLIIYRPCSASLVVPL